MNSPLDEFVECESSLSLSHSFNISATELPFCCTRVSSDSVDSTFSSSGDSSLKDVVIQSSPGPNNKNTSNNKMNKTL